MSATAKKDIEFPEPVPGARQIARLLHMVFLNLQVEGREHIPTDTQVLITFNHLGYMDVPVLASQFAPGVNWPAGFSAKKYKGTWLELFFRVGSPIWIEQDTPDRSALMTATTLIKRGHNIVIAPEGTRSRTKQLQQSKGGAAFLANRNNVAILPAAVWGTEHAFKKIRPRAHVRFGKVYHLPEGRARGPELDALSERIMCALAALLPETYHGVYRGNPLIEEMRDLVCP
jgi:1-acyl-sn-glycerol-3-phosphate acyltransferase